MAAGSQFIHIENYARKANKSSKTQGNIKGVLGEALRKDGFHPHVEVPNEPDFLFGQKSDLTGLEKEIDDRVKTEKDSLGRKIRDDVNLLIAGVCSYHRPYKAEWSSDELMALECWKELTTDFLKKEYGDSLRAVLLHTDEDHPHIHFYVLDKQDLAGSVKKWNPGVAARSALPDKTTPKHEKEAAFKKAMEGFQDSFYRSVGQMVGMTRLGPKKQRLNRQEWLAQKKQAVAFSQIQASIDEANRIFDDKWAELEGEKKKIDIRVKIMVKEHKAKLNETFGSAITQLEEKAAELEKVKNRAIKDYPEKRLIIEDTVKESRWTAPSKTMLEETRAAHSKIAMGLRPKG